ARRSGCRSRGWRRRRRRSLTTERQGRVQWRVARPGGSGEGEWGVGRTEWRLGSGELSPLLSRSHLSPLLSELPAPLSVLPTPHSPSPLPPGLATPHFSQN